MRDTIFALATAPGVAGVSIIRISGDRVAEVAAAFEIALPAARYAAVRALRVDGRLIDKALVLYFEAGHSFTGEPVLELHLHGSIAIQRIVLRHLTSVEGCRAADAGEFTRRALELGQLSLTEVEGLSDLLEAETESQHRQALQVFDGQLGARVEVWRKACLQMMAQMTVTLDFADEEVPQEVSHRLIDEMRALAAGLTQEARDGARTDRVRQGLEVALVGRPNAGKSTLLNYIAGREAAITSDIAGTTRDVIEVRYDLDGLPVTFLDTAGMRVSSDEIESIGIAMAVRRANQADLRVVLGAVPEGLDVRDGDIRVWNKADIVSDGLGLPVSGVTGLGVDVLLEQVQGTLTERVSTSSLAIRERHRTGFLRAALSLEEAADVLEQDLGDEIAAEHLTSAIRHMDVVLGRVGVEDVLGEIFSSFCIGK